MGRLPLGHAWLLCAAALAIVAAASTADSLAGSVVVIKSPYGGCLTRCTVREQLVVKAARSWQVGTATRHCKFPQTHSIMDLS